MSARQYIGARYVPKFFDWDGSPEWRPGIAYEGLTIVTRNGNSYTSKVAVPSNIGAPEENPEYWASTGTYNEQVEAYRQLALALSDRVDVAEDDIDTLEEKAIIDPDDFDGANDIAKLQNAIDYAVTQKNATINIRRVYDITGSTLLINKSLYYTSSEELRYRCKLTFIGNGKGLIYKGDSGHFFSANMYSGDVQFINVSFKGNVVLTGEDDINNRKTGCHVFDCSKLIRITTIGCSFCLVDTVFDGRLSTDTTNNMQSIRSIGDMITYSNYAVFVNLCWDVSFIGLTCEDCNSCLVGGSTAYISHVTFESCCIESMYECAIFIDVNCKVFNLNIRDCYFEDCGRNTIYITPRDVQGLNVDGCRFALSGDHRGFYMNPVLWAGCSIRNCVVSGSENAILIHTVGTQAIYVYNCAPYQQISNNADLTPRFEKNGSMYTWESASMYGTIDAPSTDNGCAMVSDVGGLTGDCLVTWHYHNATAMEFATDGVNLIWRARKSGIGWTNWASI